MTLAEFSHLVGVDAKWVLNALTSLHLPKRYSLALARRLAVAHALHEAIGVPLGRSFALAAHGLRSVQDGQTPVIIPTDDAAVGIAVDLRRIQSAFNARHSALRTTFAPRQRGRPARKRHDPLTRAADWGVDLSLLIDNGTKTVEQRVRQLDAMASFARSVHRQAPVTR